MSATPRPWTVEPNTENPSEGRWGEFVVVANARRSRMNQAPATVVAEVRNQDDAELIVRMGNVFDALLAVAKRFARICGDDQEDACGDCGEQTPRLHNEGCVYAALDAAHPGWQEWR